MKSPNIGQDLAELETPTLLIDLDLFESNIRQLYSFCNDNGKAWRPHSKANKSPEIARLLIDHGAIGITCAKLSEAELMVEHGIQSILLANQIVSPGKFATLAQLQRRAEVIAAIDNIAVVKAMGAAAISAKTTIPILIELDIGLKRVGIEPGEKTLALAKAVCGQDGLEFRGLMGYEGHVLNISPPADKLAACHQAMDLLIQSKALLEENGIEVEIVSAGGTGSYEISGLHEGITELQAGGGIFMDAMYRQALHVESLEQALTVLATVTSRSTDHVVLDAGFKTLSSYHHPPEVLDRDDLSFSYLSAEHGVFAINPGCDGPALGEQLRLLVGYSDSTTFLHDHFVAIRNGRVEKIWDIAGRGLIR